MLDFAVLGEVRRVVVKHVDIRRRARRRDAMQMVPDAIAHESCGNAPVGQGEGTHRTKLFHAHRVLGNDVGD